MNRIRDPCGICKAARPSHRMVAEMNTIVCASCDRCLQSHRFTPNAVN